MNFNRRMTEADMLRNLATMDSEHFISKVNEFDYECLQVPYAEILDDWRKGEHHQVYKNWNNSGEHLFLYRMDLSNMLDLVAYTMDRYKQKYNVGFVKPYFVKYLTNYCEPFQDLLSDRYQLL